MLGVFAAGVFDSESTGSQTEEGGTGSMGVESGRMLSWYVAEFGEVLDEAIVCELAGLGKIVHTFAAFIEDMAIADEGSEL
jgi:hypothetical protein